MNIRSCVKEMCTEVEDSRNREAERMSENEINIRVKRLREKINEENKLWGEGHYKGSRSYIRT